MDCERNTPLHMIVNYHKPISDFSTLHSIIVDLTEAGAHIDCVNIRGETPLDSSATGSKSFFIVYFGYFFNFSSFLFKFYVKLIICLGVAEIILKTQAKLSLKCMAASAVKTHKLLYKGQVPQALESFIELHGSGTTLKHI